MSVTKKFTKYVSQNVFGMIGISLYILADTFFISLAVGADGHHRIKSGIAGL